MAALARSGRAVNSISMDRFGALARAYEGAQKRIKKVQEHTEEIVDNAVHTAEIGAFSFALGSARGYFGPVDIMGVPMELAVALGAHGAAILMSGSKAAPHLRALGDAAVGAFAYGHGMETGNSWAKKAGRTFKPKQQISGDDSGNVGGLSPEERAALDGQG